MKRSAVFLVLCFFTGAFIIAQPVRISGKVADAEGKSIAGAALFLGPDGKQTISGNSGEYLIGSAPGNKQLTARALGYRSESVRFELISDTVIDFYLKLSPVELGEVVITGDSARNVVITQRGSYVVTPAAIRETPRLFSEPDLLKSVQMLPGVVSGKEGTSDLYVRGGGAGQNVVLANGCYFFLPGHLLGIVSPYDLDFLESAELYKDYFPAGLGNGASSVISLDFKKVHSDSLGLQFRAGLLSSGLILESPLRKINWELTAGIKAGNYFIYAPILKKIVSEETGDFLPPNRYSFFDGFLRLSHSSSRYGDITYLFFGNYDNCKEENRFESQSGDTLVKYTDGISTGWNNMVHSVQWLPPSGGAVKWNLNLNYNRISTGRKIYSSSEELLYGTEKTGSSETLLSFYPTVDNVATLISFNLTKEKISIDAGISDRFRYFTQNNYSLNTIDDNTARINFGEDDIVNETALFISTTLLPVEKLKIDAGIRLTGIIKKDIGFFIPEPRLRISFNDGERISPHINYVKLSQSDHSVEGSNAGLRSMLWLPVYEEFGPEISDVFSAGFQGNIEDNLTWTIDGYYKNISGMVDFRPGASFIIDTSFVDMLDRVRGKAWGVETGLIKNKGKITGSVSYTYSRSKREWGSPEGMIWIPSGADRPHNFNISMKYYLKPSTSFGLNWVYRSGAPATIYMHETSYGEFFETKNNIRYFDYHRLDISFRQIIYKRRFSIFIDADIYNLYNRKNTFYFRKTWDEEEQVYYFKNISLFPVMPSVTVTIKY